MKPYALELLQHLKKEGKKLAIATSTYDNKGMLILNHFGLLKIVDHVVFGNQVAKTKPNLDIYLSLINHFQVDKNKALIFEDSLSGLKAANNAGVDVVYVPDG